MTNIAILFCTSLLCGEPPPKITLSREQQTQIFGEANLAYDRGMELRRSEPKHAAHSLRQAVEKFQLLIDAGVVNGKLYYNLGNAHLQLGAIGRAIANYRRAERLIPRDGRLEANLRFARSLRRDHINLGARKAFQRTLFFWHYRYPLRLRYGIGLCAYVGFWLLLVITLFASGAAWRYAAMVALLALVCLAGSVLSEQVQQRTPQGVMVSDDVVARKGYAESFEPQFDQSLGEGVEFWVKEQHHDWLHIELPDGKTGWIPSEAAELI